MTTTILATILSDLLHMEVDTTVHAQEWSFVACEEDEMRKKCLICAWKSLVQEAYLPRPEWGVAVLPGSCFFLLQRQIVSFSKLGTLWNLISQKVYCFFRSQTFISAASIASPEWPLPFWCRPRHSVPLLLFHLACQVLPWVFSMYHLSGPLLQVLPVFVL